MFDFEDSCKGDITGYIGSVSVQVPRGSIDMQETGEREVCKQKQKRCFVSLHDSR